MAITQRRAPGARPQARVTRNTGLMLDAGEGILAEDGWAGLTSVAVARRMERSTTVLRTRVGGPSGLLAMLWRERLGDHLLVSLQRCVDGLARLRHDHDPAVLTDALVDLARRDPRTDAALEALLIARFEPELDEAVNETLGAAVRAWTTPLRSLPRPDAARVALVLALGIGLAIGGRAPRAATADVAAGLAPWLVALRSDVPPRRLPRRSATHIDDYPVLAEGDPALDLLLNATLEEVSRRGYDAVTVREIAAAAGYTEGLLFGRYATKLDLLLDATRRQNQAGWQLNEQFATRLQADVGRGMAEAVLLRESLLPSRWLGRSMALEQMRLGWHHPMVAAVQAAEIDGYRDGLLAEADGVALETEDEFWVNVCLSWGTYALPMLAPDVHGLPWDVVTVPLYDELERSARRRRRSR